MEKTGPSNQRAYYTQINMNTMQKHHTIFGGTMEIAQWLSMLTVLTEDLNSVPRSYMVAHNLLELQLLGI